MKHLYHFRNQSCGQSFVFFQKGPEAGPSGGMEIAHEWQKEQFAALKIDIMKDLDKGQVLTLLEQVKDAKWVNGALIDRGNSSVYVTAIQKGLSYMGFEVGTVDGLWGKSTSEALKQYQASTKRYAGAVDGLVGHKSIEALWADIQATQPVRNPKKPRQDFELSEVARSAHQDLLDFYVKNDEEGYKVNGEAYPITYTQDGNVRSTMSVMSKDESKALYAIDVYRNDKVNQVGGIEANYTIPKGTVMVRDNVQHQNISVQSIQEAFETINARLDTSLDNPM